MLRACELLPGLALDDLLRLERGEQVTLMTYAWVRANEGTGQGMRLDREPAEADPDGDPAT